MGYYVGNVIKVRQKMKTGKKQECPKCREGHIENFRAHMIDGNWVYGHGCPYCRYYYETYNRKRYVRGTPSTW